jgi:hypothetical protein
MLAEAEVNQREMAGWYNLHDCQACPRDGRCEKVPLKAPMGILGYDKWPTCPVRLLRGPHWQHVVTLYNAKSVSPLSDWPHGYAAWVVDGLCSLEAAFSRKQSAEMKKATRGGGSRGRH